MNWQVVKRSGCIRKRTGKASQQEISDLHLQQTAYLLNDEVMEFVNKEMANVVLSLDGRKEVQ